MKHTLRLPWREEKSNTARKIQIVMLLEDLLLRQRKKICRAEQK
jgi:hypothetical protein